MLQTFSDCVGGLPHVGSDPHSYGKNKAAHMNTKTASKYLVVLVTYCALNACLHTCIYNGYCAINPLFYCVCMCHVAKTQSECLGALGYLKII